MVGQKSYQGNARGGGGEWSLWAKDVVYIERPFSHLYSQANGVLEQING